MESSITVEVAPTERDFVSEGSVRAALREVEGGDLSESSPVSAGVTEAGVRPADGGAVIVAVEGHEGDFTKTSQKAITRTLAEELHGVAVEVVDGGYEPDDEDE